MKRTASFLAVALLVTLALIAPRCLFAADVSISNLPAASTLTGVETLPVVQSGATKKATVSQVLAGVPAPTLKTLNGSSLLGTGNLTLQTPLTADVDYQSPLVSGTNIKTLNGSSLIGAGNVTVQTPLTAGVDYQTPLTAGVDYQTPLVSGTSIKTVNGSSLLGSGNLAVSASPGGSSGQVQYNSAGALAGFGTVSANGSLALGGATVTASDPVLSMSQTWNNGAAALTGALLNVTDTASGASSSLIDLQVGGVSKFRVDKTGNLYPQANLMLPAAAAVDYSGRGQITFSGTSIANFKGAGGAVLGRLQFGSTGTGAPAFVFSGTTVKVRLADDSADAPLTSGPHTLGGGTVTGSAPVLDASQTWNNAAVAFAATRVNVTDTASASGSTLLDLQVGGASKLTVAKNGQVLSGYTAANSPSYSFVGDPSTGWGYRSNGAMSVVLGGSEKARFSGGLFQALDTHVEVGSARSFMFNSSTNSGGVDDAGIARNSAGVVEFHNGTKGSYAGSAMLLGAQTVAQLPACAAGVKGARASVSDATQAFSSANFGASVTGGGANFAPVVCDGSGWKIG